MFLLINLLYWPLKYFGLHKGYSMGLDLIDKGGIKIFDRLGNLANVLGVVVVGCLIPQTVKLTTALQFSLGEGDPLSLQAQFDAVMPYMLPVHLLQAHQEGQRQEHSSGYRGPYRVRARVCRDRLLHAHQDFCVTHV